MQQTSVKTTIFVVIAILVLVFFIIMGIYYLKIISTQITIKP